MPSIKPPPISVTTLDDPGNHTLDTLAVEPGAPDPADGPVLDGGTHIGRYVVQDVLGRGGMGIVYRAHDPDLGRDLAIKLLKVQAGSTTATGSQRLRILREAQALAKLSHPNIVAVHDVGTHEQSVFLAMEFVPGRTLGDWIAQENPELAPTLRVLIEAGRGLAAAHAGGLVHRDVKPDNIFVGSDGRARIGDFGLARSVDAKDSELPEEPSLTLSDEALRSGEWLKKSAAHSGVALLDYKVTMAGSILGTPQYMAAEQFRGGGAADAKTDQFSFCVTAYEALYGERPFAAYTFQEQVDRVSSGEPPRVLNNRGNAQNDLKNYASARADFERSLSVWEAALGPEHGDLSYPLTNLGRSSIGSDGMVRHASIWSVRSHWTSARSDPSTWTWPSRSPRWQTLTMASAPRRFPAAARARADHPAQQRGARDAPGGDAVLPGQDREGTGGRGAFAASCRRHAAGARR